MPTEYKYEIAEGEFIGDDTLESVCTVTYTCGAQDTSTAGVFDITATATESVNYNITFRIGTFTVNATEPAAAPSGKEGCKGALSLGGSALAIPLIIAAIVLIKRRHFTE